MVTYTKKKRVSFSLQCANTVAHARAIWQSKCVNHLPSATLLTPLRCPLDSIFGHLQMASLVQHFILVTAIARLVQCAPYQTLCRVRYGTARPLTRSSGLKINKVAALTDFSQNAGAPLRFAATVARGYKANIVLAHAHTPPPRIYSALTLEVLYHSLSADEKIWRIKSSLKPRRLSSRRRNASFFASGLRGRPRTVAPMAVGQMSSKNDHSRQE